MTPEMHSTMPNSAEPRHRGSPSSAEYEPNFTPAALPAARACTHFSGSFNRIWMKTQRNAGIAPTRNMYFQAVPAAITLVASSWPIDMLMIPAATFPTADSA